MSTIQRAYKAELDLSNAQITACKKHAGAARWAYNWGLQRKQQAYHATGRSPSAMDLHRDLNALKQTAVPWMYEVSKCAPQEALRNPDNAFAHFFRRVQLQRASKLRGKVVYPQRKTRKHGLGSFRLTGSIVVFPNAITLPRLGRLRRKERDYIPTAAQILSATVSEQAGHWYVSDRVLYCHNKQARCGLVIDRDPNAAINLAKLAGSSSERRNACGEESAGQGQRALVHLSSLKQEPNTFDASA
jgi:putative transposase